MSVKRWERWWDAYITSIKSKAECVTTMELPEDENEESYLPSKIELSVKNETLPGNNITAVENYSDKVETSYVINENKTINVNLKNNSGIVLDDVNAVVLFIKNNKIVKMENVLSYLEVNEIYEEVVEAPTYYNEDKNTADIIDYDSIKIVVNSATHDAENIEDEDVVENEEQVEE